RETEIGALRCTCALRQHPKPLKAHNVVDAYATGMAKGGAQHFDECSKPAQLQPARRECGKPPILAKRAERVGWRADAEAKEGLVLPAPGVLAAAVGADSEVGDQADAHASVTCLPLCGAETAIREELQIRMERHLSRVITGEFLDGGTGRVAKPLRP